MAKKAVAKSATPTTVTLKHLAAALAEEHELSKKQTETILSDMVTRITKHLKKLQEDLLSGRELSEDDAALVAEVDGRFAGFCWVMRPGQSYASENYVWFSQQYDDFVYLDRIAVLPDYRRYGIGRMLVKQKKIVAVNQENITRIGMNLIHKLWEEPHARAGH